MEFSFVRLDVVLLFRIKFFTFSANSFFCQIRSNAKSQDTVRPVSTLQGNYFFLLVYAVQSRSQNLMQSNSNLKIVACHGMIYLQLIFKITDISNLTWFLEHTERPIARCQQFFPHILSCPEKPYFGISGVFINFSFLVFNSCLKPCQNNLHSPDHT